MDALAIVKQFKLVIVGDGGVGKTSYLRQYANPELKKPSYDCRVEIQTIVLHTSHGPIKLHIWDTSGHEKFGGLRDGYYIGSHAAIIMFDLSARITYKNVPRWYKDITRICQNIPIALVANKLDLQQRKVKPKHIKFPKRKNLPYCQISTKANYQWQLPLFLLLKKLLNDENLKFVQPVPLREPSLELDPQLIEKAKIEWEQVQAEEPGVNSSMEEF